MTPSQSSTDDEVVLFEGRPAVIAGLGPLLLTILTVGLAAIYFWAKAHSVFYKVTTHRVLLEAGMFSKRLEQVDSYRIKDYVVERPFGQRLLGTGNLVLHTMDQTTPTIALHGVRTNVVTLYEKLRAAAETQRQRRGVRLLDNE